MSVVAFWDECSRSDWIIPAADWKIGVLHHIQRTRTTKWVWPPFAVDMDGEHVRREGEHRYFLRFLPKT